jgi:uncharacterized membrane protein YphA (DoxX/SURF4 family)
MHNNKILIVIKYLIAILFIYAGVYKIMDVEIFKSQMGESPLLPETLIPYIAIILPISEIVLGLCLIFNIQVLFSLWTSSLLMVFFSCYLIILFTMYEKPPCACGGILSKMDYPEHIVFNIIYTLICIVAVYLYEKKQTN